MKIKIIGAGFSGLALCRHLQYTLPKASIEIWDKNLAETGASAIAAGLLHPYVGQGAKLNWKGKEAMQTTLDLLQSVSSNCYSQSGILRLAIKGIQKEEFFHSAQKHADVSWKSAEEIAKILPNTGKHPGIMIETGVQVYCRQYLMELGKLCKTDGAELIQEEVGNPINIDADLVILAMGADTPELKLQKMKGQILQMEWPSSIPPLPFPLIGSCYIVMSDDKKSCWVGSTYERAFDHSDPDLPRAKSELIPKIKETFPPLANAKILDCQAGVRAFTPDKRPTYVQLNEKTWAITGMGSKGLLYHSLIAKELAGQLGSDSE